MQYISFLGRVMPEEALQDGFSDFNPVPAPSAPAQHGDSEANVSAPGNKI